MKRVALVLSLFALLALSSGVVTAQDASPVASPVVSTPPSAPLLEGLGYPTLEVSYDGTTLTAPTEIPAGRYRIVFTNSSATPLADFSMGGPPEGMSLDELEDAILALDPTADSAPDFFYQVTLLGGTDNSSAAVFDIPPGEWLMTVQPFSEEPTSATTVAQKVNVTGEMPDYPAIDGAVQVKLVDLSIDMPDTIPAGPTIFEVTNDGAIVHFWFVMKATGPITTEEAVNGVKWFYGMPDATPAAAGSAADPQTWSDVGGIDPIRNGGTVLTELDLEPGTYIAFCFIEGPGDLGSHALHGMTKVFTVE